jgi:branched-chain amino acid transport system substrate-binding protein
MQGGLNMRQNRRRFLALAGAGAASAFVPARFAIGQQAKLKLGLMLPYSGTYAALGANITDALKLRITEGGGKLGGRDIEYVQLDDESNPAKGRDNAARLLTRDRVDILIGTVHSGVALAMAQVAREENKFLVIPNAGANDLTRRSCAPILFRTSFSNWQPAFPCGQVAIADGKRKAVVMTWNYPAGQESSAGFKESFTAGGGQVVKEILIDFPQVEFQAGLTDIAAQQPDCVYAFFAGAGALKFMRDYAAAGLQGRIPLYHPGFLTDGVMREAGAAANGVKGTLHYADDLPNELNRAFRPRFKTATTRDADVYAVQGYDTGTFLIKGLEAVHGDVAAQRPLIQAFRGATIESPRGTFTLSPQGNPVQDIYLKAVENGEEKYVRTVSQRLADPGTGCSVT